MSTTEKGYQPQINKAKETMGILENNFHMVRNKLQKEPLNADYLKELKQITLEMTITLNELEHYQTLSKMHADNRGFGSLTTPVY